ERRRQGIAGTPPGGGAGSRERRSGGRGMNLRPPAPGLHPSRVHVASGSGGYDVLIAPALLGALGQTLRSMGVGGRVALVSDTTVLKTWGAFATESLEAAGYSVSTMVVPPGEATKSLRGAEQL